MGPARADDDGIQCVRASYGAKLVFTLSEKASSHAAHQALEGHASERLAKCASRPHSPAPPPMMGSLLVGALGALAASGAASHGP